MTPPPIFSEPPSFLKTKSFPQTLLEATLGGFQLSRKRESTSHLIKNFMFLVLLVCFAVEAGQRPPLPPPPSPSPALQREKEKVLNLGNLIQGRLPENSKDNQSTPSDNVPAVPGVVVQGTLRINVDSFKDFKICDKTGECHQVCFKDGTGCPSCKAPCAELCARRATKLCKFGEGRSKASSDAFTSTEEDRFPEFIDQLKRICFSDGDATKNNYAADTTKHNFHYTCRDNYKGCKRGTRGSGGGYHHDRAFGGFVNCMDELIATGKCPAYSCKRCRNCVNNIGVGKNHHRISNWKKSKSPDGRNQLYLCNDECGGTWERVITPNLGGGGGNRDAAWKARLKKCGKVDECPLLPN